VTVTNPIAPRRFGLTVGGVFLLLGSIAAWRGHVLSPRVLLGVAGGLIVPALVAPRLLVPVERAWMAFAHVLGTVNTKLILGLLYYVVFTPAGVLRRRFSDPLARRLGGSEASYWVRRESGEVDPARYRRQF